MIHVIIKYKNNSTNTTSCKNSKVAKAYVDAVLNVYQHDGLIDDVLRIETVDYMTKESKIVYPVQAS
ncbi:MAG TPA: hypothetical protein PLP48_06515 [Acholeplasmataceae bacterium]|nr:hypothetical protein [Acholeplasmataceae bacterium]